MPVRKPIDYAAKTPGRSARYPQLFGSLSHDLSLLFDLAPNLKALLILGLSSVCIRVAIPDKVAMLSETDAPLRDRAERLLVKKRPNAMGAWHFLGARSKDLSANHSRLTDGKIRLHLALVFNCCQICFCLIQPDLF